MGITVLLDVYLILLALQLNGMIPGTELIRTFLLIIMLLYSAEKFVLGKRRHGRFTLKYNLAAHSVLYAAYIGVLFFVAWANSKGLSINRMVELLFFPLCSVLCYIHYSKIKKLKTFDKILDLQFIVLVIQAAIFYVGQVIGTPGGLDNVNTVYYVVFMLPFALVQKKRLKKYSGIFLIVLSVFFSAKRGAFLAVAAACVFALHKYNEKKGSKALKYLISGSVALGLALVLNSIFSDYFSIDILGRMASLTEDGGSGRMDLARLTIQQLKRSSLLELTFGHNLRPTFLVVNLGAHNDFLEVIYRLGAVGFILYLMFYKHMLRIRRTALKKNHALGVSMMDAMLIIFAVLSFSSQLVFLPTYIATVAMASHYVSARVELEDALSGQEKRPDSASCDIA